MVERLTLGLAAFHVFDGFLPLNLGMMDDSGGPIIESTIFQRVVYSFLRVCELSFVLALILDLIPDATERYTNCELTARGQCRRARRDLLEDLTNFPGRQPTHSRSR